jgi:hypothetical protein
MDELLRDALAANCETAQFDFKQQFDTESSREWLEIIKDVVAIANSGGGVILFGLDNTGQPSGDEVSHVTKVDPAVITDKIKRYTGQQFGDFVLTQVDKEGHIVVALCIAEASLPIVFEKPGTYGVDGKKQRRAFSEGTVYFRHGAKSEPGNTEDLRQALEREVDRRRQQWLENIRKVVEAPPDSEVRIVTKDTEGVPTGPRHVRLVDDPDAIPVEQINPDETHPHRQKELTREVRKQLGKGFTFNSYDVQCLKAVHHVHVDQRFCYQPKYGSMQYSDALVEWVVERCKEDVTFLDENRKEHYRQRYGRAGTQPKNVTGAMQPNLPMTSPT